MRLRLRKVQRAAQFLLPPAHLVAELVDLFRPLPGQARRRQRQPAVVVLELQGSVLLVLDLVAAELLVAAVDSAAALVAVVAPPVVAALQTAAVLRDVAVPTEADLVARRAVVATVKN